MAGQPGKQMLRTSHMDETPISASRMYIQFKHALSRFLHRTSSNNTHFEPCISMGPGQQLTRSLPTASPRGRDWHMSETWIWGNLNEGRQLLPRPTPRSARQRRNPSQGANGEIPPGHKCPSRVSRRVSPGTTIPRSTTRRVNSRAKIRRPPIQTVKK